VLAAAFYDYPVLRYFLRDAGASYDDHLLRLNAFYFDARLARRHPVLGIRETDRIAGVALVSEPGSGGRFPAIQALFDRLEEEIGSAALARMKHYDEAASRGMPEAPFHYLGMVGVPGEHQGKGHGGALVRAVHELAARHPESTGVCLHTEVEENVALYEHLGYRTMAVNEIAGLRSHCMFRPSDPPAVATP
jgi:GNAT superfamily N-acetyltransferase